MCEHTHTRNAIITHAHSRTYELMCNNLHDHRRTHSDGARARTDPHGESFEYEGCADDDEPYAMLAKFAIKEALDKADAVPRKVFFAGAIFARI